MEPTQEIKRVAPTLDQVKAEQCGYPEIKNLERVVDYVASNRTGGGHALAQLLMSCYNGSEYPFDITELCRLDDEFYQDALAVIRLRTRLDREPHEFFVDGGRLFNQIAQDYGIQSVSDLVEEPLE